MPAAELDRPLLDAAAEEATRQSARSGRAGGDQGLTGRSFQHAAVACAADGPGRAEQVGAAGPPVRSVAARQTPVALETEPAAQRPPAELNGVLHEYCELTDVGLAAKLEAP